MAAEVKMRLTYRNFTTVFSNIVLLAAFAALSKLSIAQDRTTDRQLSVREGDKTVLVNVWTGGCTKREDFRIRKESIGREVTVILQRITPDNCKGFFPEGTWLEFRKEELGNTNASSFNFFEATRIEGERR